MSRLDSTEKEWRQEPEEWQGDGESVARLIWRVAVKNDRGQALPWLLRRKAGAGSDLLTKQNSKIQYNDNGKGSQWI